MWDGLFLLLLLCFFMTGISYLVGSLPLALTLSSRQLRLVTALGTGVLVGTSLIVIIPEGIETLYGAADTNAVLLGRRATSLAAVPAITLRDVQPFVISTEHTLWQRDHDGYSADATPSELPEPAAGTPSDQSGDAHHTQPIADGDTNEDEEADDEDSHDPHSLVGVSLVLGFILMYLIDTLPKQAGTSSQPQRFSISLHQFSFQRGSSAPPESDTASLNGDYRPGDSHAHVSRSSSTAVGLIIHAVADGIALGASSTTTTRLTFIIFFALIIHKAPAAFGLTSVLLKQGLSKRMSRFYLIVFSLAAPAGALVTWAAAHLIGFASSSDGSNSTEYATGVILLFSAGTFLYVAMHAMQEDGDSHDSHGANGYASVPMSVYGEQPPVTQAKDGSKMTETLVTVAGMLVPLLTQIGHAH